MRDVQIIPHERNKEAKAMYLVFDWYYRAHKKEIRKKINNAIKDCMLYGKGVIHETWL